MLLSTLFILIGFPWWLSGKESTCNTGATEDTASIPESGRSPAEGNGNPLQWSCLENLTDREAWQATAYGVTKSMAQLSDSTTTSHSYFVI